MNDIARRLSASIRIDAHNGDAMERSVCAMQAKEAIQYISKLEQENAELKSLPAVPQEVAELVDAFDEYADECSANAAPDLGSAWRGARDLLADAIAKANER